MNILFGDSNQQFPDNLILLELDTFRIPPDLTPRTAYCAIDIATVGPGDLSKLPALKQLHRDIIENYRLRQWDYCDEALENIRTAWNGELVTFYDSLRERVAQHREVPPPDDWDGSITK